MTDHKRPPWQAPRRGGYSAGPRTPDQLPKPPPGPAPGAASPPPEPPAPMLEPGPWEAHITGPHGGIDAIVGRYSISYSNRIMESGTSFAYTRSGARRKALRGLRRLEREDAVETIRSVTPRNDAIHPAETAPLRHSQE